MTPASILHLESLDLDVRVITLNITGDEDCIAAASILNDIEIQGYRQHDFTARTVWVDQQNGFTYGTFTLVRGNAQQGNLRIEVYELMDAGDKAVARQNVAKLKKQGYRVIQQLDTLVSGKGAHRQHTRHVIFRG